MRYLFPILALISIALCSCKEKQAVESVHDEVNGVYYWKTVFDLDSADRQFLADHDVRRMYVRMFDVTPNAVTYVYDEATVPNASLKVDGDGYQYMSDTTTNMEFVPVVYITVEALKAMEDEEEILAANIVERVANMCSYNEISRVEELQLDCDWTTSTEDSFFKLCESVKAQLEERELPWRLSSTIRLHQLARPVPPVDNGVLMVYNTGAFDDPDSHNSIIDAADVEPYLKNLPEYELHLDVAYPTYSWQLLFRGRRFAGLMQGLDLANTENFSSLGGNKYRALKDMPYHDTTIYAGDIVRAESSSYGEVARVKAMIEEKLKDRPHSNILYHLDSKNLTKYSKDEIASLYNTGN